MAEVEPEVGVHHEGKQRAGTKVCMHRTAELRALHGDADRRLRQQQRQADDGRGRVRRLEDWLAAGCEQNQPALAAKKEEEEPPRKELAAAESAAPPPGMDEDGDRRRMERPRTALRGPPKVQTNTAVKDTRPTSKQDPVRTARVIGEGDAESDDDDKDVLLGGGGGGGKIMILTMIIVPSIFFF